MALGGTAATSLAGPSGEGAVGARPFTDDQRGFRLLVTVHPSMILRLPEEVKADAYAAFVRDLRKAA